MSVSREDLQDFNRFADEKFARGGVESFAALVQEWEAAREHARSLEDLHESHADAEAGRVRPLGEAFAEVGSKLGQPE